MKITSTEIAAIAATVISLCFSYIPGLNTKYAALADEVKRLIMLAVLAAVTAALYGLACTGVADSLGLAVTCDTTGLIGLLREFMIAVIVNQSVYSISPRTLAVKKAKR